MSTKWKSWNREMPLSSISSSPNDFQIHQHSLKYKINRNYNQSYQSFLLKRLCTVYTAHPLSLSLCKGRGFHRFLPIISDVFVSIPWNDLKFLMMKSQEKKNKIWREQREFTQVKNEEKAGDPNNVTVWEKSLKDKKIHRIYVYYIYWKTMKYE